MSEKNSKNEDWPEIGSLICINPGTRLLTDDGNIAIVPYYEDEIIGMVVEHHPECELIADQLDVLVEDKVYRIVRQPSPDPSIDPYFNIRGISDDGTNRSY